MPDPAGGGECFPLICLASRSNKADLQFLHPCLEGAGIMTNAVSQPQDIHPFLPTLLLTNPLATTLTSGVHQAFLTPSCDDIQCIPGSFAFLLWLLALYTFLQNHHLLHFSLKFKSHMFGSCFPFFWYLFPYHKDWLLKWSFSPSCSHLLLVRLGSCTVRCTLCPSSDFHSPPWSLIFQRIFLVLFCCFFFPH